MKRWLLLAPLLLGGCIDSFEGIWFNPEVLTEYTWPEWRTVPDDHIELVELPGTQVEGEEQPPTLFGVWAHQCLDTEGLCLPGQPDCACAEPDADEFDPARQDDVILYFHGNARNLEGYWDRIEMLWKRGHPVFAIDYRGYGMSTGTPSEAGIYADARSAHREAIGRIADARDLRGEDGSLPPALLTGVTYWGFSLGSTAATDLAVWDAPRALVLEAALAGSQAFTDDALRLGLSHTILMDTRFDNISKIPSVVSPKLIMHGTEDDFVRFEFGQQLLEAANEPKQFYAVVGAGHGNVPCPTREQSTDPVENPCIAGEDFSETLGSFFEEALP